jgi:molybdopterin-guanine dinucleotide biosynthesis protein A
MERTVILLAGGLSKRFGQDKALLELNGKPLVCHVLDAVKKLVDEVIVVTNSNERIENYSKLLGPKVIFAHDIEEAKGPLVGALTGLKKAQGKFSLLLPSDTPFVSSRVVELLFDLCHSRSAVIPRWPNTQIEPLHSVYRTDIALAATQKAVDEGNLQLLAMLDHMQRIRYLSTMVIQELDPELKTFFNVNTPIDLKKAESISNPNTRKIA